MTLPASRHVWLNGRLLPSDVPHLSVYDRGFQLGDGIFETLRARRGVPIELDGHLVRLHDSARSLSLGLPFGDAELAAGVADLLQAEGHAGRGDDGGPVGDAVVRITISRGFDPTRSVPPDVDGTASVAIQVWPYAPLAPQVLERGERLVVSAIPRDPASPLSGVKSISRAELVYARLEAGRAGADDAIFLTADGRVTEATTSNLLVFRGGICLTPPLSSGILAGTTRAWLVHRGAESGVPIVEQDLRLSDVLSADEVALCASIGGVIPVGMVDGHVIGEGRPGAMTMALREARERWIDALSLAVSAPTVAAGESRAEP